MASQRAGPLLVYSPKPVNDGGVSKYSDLAEAIKDGNLAFVQQYVENHLNNDINHRLSHNQTLLQLACKTLNLDVLKWLLPKKPELVADLGDNGRTAVHLLLLHNRSTDEEEVVEALELLLEAGIDLEAADLTGKTPYLLAAETRRAKFATWFVKNGRAVGSGEAKPRFDQIAQSAVSPEDSQYTATGADASRFYSVPKDLRLKAITGENHPVHSQLLLYFNGEMKDELAQALQEAKEKPGCVATYETFISDTALRLFIGYLYNLQIAINTKQQNDPDPWIQIWSLVRRWRMPALQREVEKKAATCLNAMITTDTGDSGLGTTLSFCYSLYLLASKDVTVGYHLTHFAARYLALNLPEFLTGVDCQDMSWEDKELFVAALFEKLTLIESKDSEFVQALGQFNRPAQPKAELTLEQLMAHYHLEAANTHENGSPNKGAAQASRSAQLKPRVSPDGFLERLMGSSRPDLSTTVKFHVTKASYLWGTWGMIPWGSVERYLCLTQEEIFRVDPATGVESPYSRVPLAAIERVKITKLRVATIVYKAPHAELTVTMTHKHDVSAFSKALTERGVTTVEVDS